MILTEEQRMEKRMMVEEMQRARACTIRDYATTYDQVTKEIMNSVKTSGCKCEVCEYIRAKDFERKLTIEEE